MSYACSTASFLPLAQGVQHLAGHRGRDGRGTGRAADHQIQVVQDQLFLIQDASGRPRAAMCDGALAARRPTSGWRSPSGGRCPRPTSPFWPRQEAAIHQFRIGHQPAAGDDRHLGDADVERPPFAVLVRQIQGPGRRLAGQHGRAALLLGHRLLPDRPLARVDPHQRRPDGDRVAGRDQDLLQHAGHRRGDFEDALGGLQRGQRSGRVR